MENEKLQKLVTYLRTKETIIHRMAVTEAIANLKFNTWLKQMDDAVVESMQLALSDGRLSDKTRDKICKKFVENMIKKSKEIKERIK